MDQVREIEHKFRVHGLYRIPDLTHVEGIERVADHGTVDLDATYYDTDDLRLVRDGITLRRRVGGSDEGWHLKLPTSQTGVRDELQLPLSDPRNGPPEALTGIITVIARDRPVRPVASLHSNRHRHLLHDAHDQPVAELVDDHVAVVSPDGATTARFRELELELATDSTSLTGVINALTAAGASEGTFVAKAVRALGPDAAAAPEIPAPPELQPSDAAARYVTAYFATQVRALRWHDIRFRQDPGHPGDHIHQMRVSARRLRSGLRVFSPLLDKTWGKELAGELRWFARGLTELRETEVLLPRLEADTKRLSDDSAADQVLGLIRERLGDTLARSRADAVRLISTDRYLALHDRLVDTIHSPRTTGAADAPAADVFPGLARQAWKRLERSVEQRAAEASDEHWHEVRLAAKRARYAGEAVASALGADAATYVKRMKRLTSILGEHQDAAQAADRVGELAADPSIRGDTAAVFGLGVIAGLERGTAIAERERFRAAWRKTGNAGKLLRGT